jgi:P-type E1-E2 ATPase
MPDDRILETMAIAEARSEHPLGKAIVAHFKQETGISPAQPDEFALLVGRGVVSCFAGAAILAGNEALMKERGVEMPPALVESASTARNEGCTVIYLAIDSKAAGMVALSDTLRPDAAETIGTIHAPGTRTVLLTGDASLAANHMARIAGITDVKANCLPEDKMAAIRGYQERGEPVCMVGDGINDAPALKTAHVGIAMGGIGSDIAIDAADIALVGDNIRELPHLLKLAKKTMRTIMINLTASMVLNFAAIGFAIAGVLNPVFGALVHNAGSVAVIINSSLLLKWRDSQ